MKNNIASNIQHPKSNTAITLIVLIITIIVLLILAAVTLNMVLGKNGIIAKARNSKRKHKLCRCKRKSTSDVIRNKNKSDNRRKKRH